MRATREYVPKFRRSINCLRVSAPAFDAPWHFHPELELTWIQSGRGRRFVGDSVEAFEPGDLVLLGSGLPHQWRCEDTDAGRGGPAEALVLHFDAAFLGAGAWQREELTGVGQLLERSEAGIAVCGAGAEEIKTEMAAVFAATPPMRMAMLLRILCRLIEPTVELRELSSAAWRNWAGETPGRAPAEPRLQRVMALVNREFRRDVSLAEAAAAAAMSSTAFCRYLRERSGRTFLELLHERRVTEACRMLTAGDALVADVAESCGYGNLSNFNRQFKRITGHTPRAYRKRYGSVARR